MSGAVILPEKEDIAVDPAMATRLEDARRELHTRPADSNEAAAEFYGENARDALANESRMPTRTAQIAGDAPTKAKPAPAPQKPAADVYDGEEVPELKGKSAREIAAEYRSLHRQIGVQGAELGAYRKKADELLRASLAARTAAPGTQAAEKNDGDAADLEIEYFANPKTAISKAVESHPVMQGLKAAATATLHRKVGEALTTEFPDHAATLADPEFRKYVSASPVRMALLKQAHQGYSLEAARELFGTWRALKGSAAPTSEKPADVKTPAKAADAKTPAKGRRVFKRSEVQALMDREPERYAAMADEIAAAYARGDVR
jgi:hypothetical protein